MILDLINVFVAVSFQVSKLVRCQIVIATSMAVSLKRRKQATEATFFRSDVG